MGITFDGDADRALFADENGRVVNGDAVLLLAGRDLQARGLLTNSTVVATTMSNMGLEAALKRSGIQMLRAAVGDKYVLEQMIATGAALGGEQSGHIIFTGRSTTGDRVGWWRRRARCLRGTCLRRRRERCFEFEPAPGLPGSPADGR